jgi:hypothetical protein
MGISKFAPIVLLFLASCSSIIKTTDCVVYKNGLVIGRTSVTIKENKKNLSEYCHSITGCKKLELVLTNSNEIFLNEVVEKDQTSQLEFLLGKIENDLFTNGDKNLPDVYKKYQNYQVDKNAMLVKQVLDTNILFYNKNEVNYFYNEYCSIPQAIIGAMAVGFMDNIKD